MRIWAVLSILPLISSCATQTGLLRFDDYTAHAASYARAAALPPTPRSSQAPELRVWGEAAVVDYSWGWVLTSDRIRRYDSGSKLVQGVATYDGRNLVLGRSEVLREFPAEIAALMPSITALSGTAVSCPVKDGAGYTIEGIWEGRYFALAAHNPTLCVQDETRPIVELISALSRLSGDRP